MFSPILSPNELEKLKKAGDSLKSSDKQKEKVMEMIRMNGKEWNTMSAGREEVGIPKPKKNQIEDLAEKAQIIKESRNIVYQLQQNKAYAEQKQAEFFQKQAKPIVEGQYEIYNQKTGQYEKVGVMNAIKENLAKNGIIAEKIEALNETINEIVDSIDISDGLENIKELIKELIDTKQVNTKGDIKRILIDREIQFEHYDLKEIIIDILNENLKVIVRELIQSGKVNTKGEIKKELKKMDIEYDKDVLREIVNDIMEE